MLHAVMAVKNEAERWLRPVLADLETRGVATLVCDDGSTDDSISVARQFTNVVVTSRPEGIPSFLQHEGYFRQWCWTELVKCAVREGDWVLSIDADEFLLGEPNANAADEITAWSIPMVIVWGIEDGIVYERKDGFWGTDEQPRLARWQNRVPVFPDRKMGSGSLPLYARKNVVHSPWERIMHFGYARPEDRAAKYERYTTHSFGHNSQHIESIRTSPTLVRWEGRVPCLQPAS